MYRLTVHLTGVKQESVKTSKGLIKKTMNTVSFHGLKSKPAALAKFAQFKDDMRHIDIWSNAKVAIDKDGNEKYYLSFE